MRGLSRLGVVCCCLLVATSIVWAQKPKSAAPTQKPKPPASTQKPKNILEDSSPWVLDVQTDAMTDAKTLTATATVRLAPDSPYVYQLSLKCNGSERTTTLGTFSLAGMKDGYMAPRPIPFGAGPLEPERGHYVRIRADSGEPVRMMLTVQAGNVGYVTAMSDEMPSSRIVIADVFPDETAVFPFSALTAMERTAMQKLCFPQGDVSPEAQKKALAWLAEQVEGKHYQQLDNNIGTATVQQNGATVIVVKLTFSFEDHPYTATLYINRSTGIVSLQPPK